MPIKHIARAGERITEALRDFLHLESAGGILLMFATVAALVVANTRAERLYQSFLAAVLGYLLLRLMLASVAPAQRRAVE